MHGQYNDSKLLWKEKGSAAHMSFQSPATRQCFSSILCVSLYTYPLPHPCLWGELSPHCRSKAASSLQRRREPANPYCPACLGKGQPCSPPPRHHSFKSTLKKFIPFGPSRWIPPTGTFLLVPVSLLSPVRAVPWGFCHNNGSSEMVTEHLLTPRKMGFSHYF